jgi:hypothetical protein
MTRVVRRTDLNALGDRRLRRGAHGRGAAREDQDHGAA